jgi:hypothetical protein
MYLLKLMRFQVLVFSEKREKYKADGGGTLCVNWSLETRKNHNKKTQKNYETFSQKKKF